MNRIVPHARLHDLRPLFSAWKQGHKRRRHERRGCLARIEQLENRVLLANDFGDAPAPYPTLLAENGAVHTANGLTLGAERDMEADGDHSPNARGDDNTGTPDDEDGVTFGALMVGALGATATVNVQGLSGVGKLDAWIDFNGDGSWGGPGEQIASSAAVMDGDNTIAFNVPSWAVDGETFARFRLSTAGNLAPEGPAADGEVEEHLVTIDPPAASDGDFGARNEISTSADGAYSVVAADVDGDGDMDVIAALKLENKIAWYKNDGSQNFMPRTVSTAVSGPVSVFASDLDRDGDMDFLSASKLDNQIAWYDNDGSENFTSHTISTEADGAASVFAADLDGDGDIDVISASTYDSEIIRYENDGSQGFTPFTITTNAFFARSVFAADVDRDGDMDVLSASEVDDRIAWYENNGSQSFTEHTISADADSAKSVFAADVDDDGDMDVLSASLADDEITWYENNGSQTFTPHLISSAVEDPYSVSAADLDSDGDLDVLSASFRDDQIAWYENDGNENFAQRTISTNADGALAVIAADVDGDGDLDVLSASYNDDMIAWYKNRDVIPDTDFGDAPQPYPTTLAEDGARHNSAGPRLGSNRDGETDGDHSTAANADDTTGSPDDEDGVTFGTMMVGALGATVTVNVQGADGRLSAWIDFNGDGSWGGPGEHIFAARSVVVGDNNLTFDVPSWAKDGTTFARFRLSTTGNLGPAGPAVDGEVEDYAVTLLSPTTTNGTISSEIVISTAADSARSVFAADLDGDGDMDVLSASSNDDKIAWYENIGSQYFTERPISTAAVGAYSVFATDIDGDGDQDVLSASTNDDEIALYLNDGAAPPTFTELAVSAAAFGAVSVFAADVDGDGSLDVLSASIADHKIALYSTFPTFVAMPIGTAANPRSVLAADMDGDGDMDVLSASPGDDAIAWYVNDGHQNFTVDVISSNADGAASVFAADLDGDGDLDVLSASANDDKIAWYVNNTSPNVGVTMSVAPSSITETGGTFRVTATLSSVSALDVTVDLGFSGAATNGMDYTSSATEIVIAAGNTSGSVTLAVVKDTFDESDETIVVDITGVTNGTESGTQQGTVFIFELNLDVTGPTVTDVRLIGAGVTITTVEIQFSERLDPSDAADPGNYTIVGAGSDNRFDTADDVDITYGTPTYDDAQFTVRITPTAPLVSNQFFRVTVDGTSSVTDLAGNRLDGNRNGTSGDYIASFARGTNLTYFDLDDDRANLKVKRGVLDVIRRSDGQVETLRATKTGIAPAVLSGSVRRSADGNGTAVIGALRGVSAGITNNLRAPAFQIGTISAVVVDRLLDDGELFPRVLKNRRFL